MTMWNEPCNKKVGTASIGVFILGGFIVLLVYNAEVSWDQVAYSKTGQQVVTAISLSVNTGNKGLISLPSTTRNDDIDRDQQCDMQKKIALIKIPQAGSHTTASVLQRFGYEQGLNFVLPKDCPDGDMGFPGGLMYNMLLNQEVDEYNLLVHQTVYDKDEFHQLIMAPDTQFITILREPLSHLRSCFFHFGMDKRTGLVLAKNPLGGYLDHPWVYEYSSIAKRAQVTMTKNLQAYVLGWKDRYSQDRRAVRKFISQLDMDFPLVLILEYFDASLVLLKRLMCWTFYNILYDKQHRNQQIYTRPESEYTKQQLWNHRNSSWIDYHLYEHFNRTFWRKIERAGTDFQEELAAFQKLNDEVNSYCSEGATDKRTFPGSKWSEPLEIGPELCGELKRESEQWDIKICHRAGAYGEMEMQRKETMFTFNKAHPKAQYNIEEVVAKVMKVLPGVDLGAVLKKHNVPAAKFIKEMHQHKYSVHTLVQNFLSIEKQNTVVQQTRYHHN